MDPATAGTCELLAWEAGSTDASGVQRRTIQVGPTPGPTPPGPVPGPPALKKASLPSYGDALTQATQQGRPLVVWVNCPAPEQPSTECVFTTAAVAWNDATPRIVLTLYDAQARSLYWAKDLPTGRWPAWRRKSNACRHRSNSEPK